MYRFDFVWFVMTSAKIMFMLKFTYLREPDIDILKMKTQVVSYGRQTRNGK